MYSAWYRYLRYIMRYTRYETSRYPANVFDIDIDIYIPKISHDISRILSIYMIPITNFCRVVVLCLLRAFVLTSVSLQHSSRHWLVVLDVDRWEERFNLIWLTKKNTYIPGILVDTWFLYLKCAFSHETILSAHRHRAQPESVPILWSYYTNKEKQLLRFSTVDVRTDFSEGSHFTSPIPHPKTDLSKNQIAFRYIISYPKYTKTYFFETRLAFWRFWVKGPRHSENVLAEICYLYRRMCISCVNKTTPRRYCNNFLRSKGRRGLLLVFFSVFPNFRYFAVFSQKRKIPIFWEITKKLWKTLLVKIDPTKKTEWTMQCPSYWIQRYYNTFLRSKGRRGLPILVFITIFPKFRYSAVFSYL